MKNFKVRTISDYNPKGFNDLVEKIWRNVGDEFYCTEERANYLLEHKAIEIIEEVPAIENVVETLDKIRESAKKEVELNQFGNPVGTRELKSKKKKSNKK